MQRWHKPPAKAKCRPLVEWKDIANSTRDLGHIYDVIYADRRPRRRRGPTRTMHARTFAGAAYNHRASRRRLPTGNAALEPRRLIYDTHLPESPFQLFRLYTRTRNTVFVCKRIVETKLASKFGQCLNRSSAGYGSSWPAFGVRIRSREKERPNVYRWVRLGSGGEV